MEEGKVADSNLHLVREIRDVRGPLHHTEDPVQNVSGVVYSPALEWPGSAELDCLASPLLPGIMDGNAPTSGSPLHSSVSLRLLVQQSLILPKKHSLAIIDGYEEVQMGRDVAPPGSDTPRIRLKEMEVSKLHATVYWDRDRREWAVVDMGSKHGTFLKSHRRPGSTIDVPVPSTSQALGLAGEGGRGLRLSPSRMASVPRRLEHLNSLTVGSTTFTIHIHDGQVPCVDCSSKGGDEIPLHGAGRASSDAGRKRKRASAGVGLDGSTYPSSPVQRDPKKALTMLKQTLLSHHNHNIPSSTVEGTSPYVDRSARRRALHPDTSAVIRTDTPDMHATASVYIPSPRAAESVPSSSTTPSIDATLTPLPDTNIGHRLLLRQGWQPGTSLGLPDSSDVALLEPLGVGGNIGRAGLGMATSSIAANEASRSSNRKGEGRSRWWASQR